MLTLEELFKKILDSAFKVHSALGPGLLESAYKNVINVAHLKNGIKRMILS